MKLILARHGNTFNSGETAVWVGSRNDLPLVAKGRAQANMVADYLKQAAIVPTAIYCGPLQRTRIYAQIIVEALGLTSQPTVDHRLNEIDYGAWTGLSNEQIRLNFGTRELEAWEKNSQWPDAADWQGSVHLINEEIQSFSKNIIKKHAYDAAVLIVSSNGRLRYFLKLVSGAFEHHLAQQTFKMATGNISQLSYADNQWIVDFWNQAPHNKLEADQHN